MNVFLETRKEYNNLNSRNSFMGAVLHKMGIGADNKNVDFVQKITDRHQEKIMAHKKERERMILK